MVVVEDLLLFRKALWIAVLSSLGDFVYIILCYPLIVFSATRNSLLLMGGKKLRNTVNSCC